jgi:hypothetical protein
MNGIGKMIKNSYYNLFNLELTWFDLWIQLHPSQILNDYGTLHSDLYVCIYPKENKFGKIWFSKVILLFRLHDEEKRFVLLLVWAINLSTILVFVKINKSINNPNRYKHILEISNWANHKIFIGSPNHPHSFLPR